MIYIIILYLTTGFSVFLANEHKNTFAGNVFLIAFWPPFLLALFIKRILK